jgi:hypothetical protein
MSECGNSVQTTPQQILLFGGFQDVNFQDLNFPFGDAWVFQGTLQWAGPFFGARIPHPAARSGAGMAYYPVSNQAVLFGGLAASNSFPQDTWNGFCSPLSWTQVFPAHSPGGRFAPGMTTGPNGFTLVLFGGQGASPPFPPLNDTWTWGRRAACVPADGSQVSVGSEVKCQFDPADGIQFGGWSTNGFGPPFRHQLTATFHTAAPGAASIMAQWTDADGSHSETFSYTIARPNH